MDLNIAHTKEMGLLCVFSRSGHQNALALVTKQVLLPHQAPKDQRVNNTLVCKKTSPRAHDAHTLLEMEQSAVDLGVEANSTSTPEAISCKARYQHFGT